MANMIPTWAEVNVWVALLAIGLVFFVCVWLKGKREEERTVTWIKEEW